MWTFFVADISDVIFSTSVVIGSLIKVDVAEESLVLLT